MASREKLVHQCSFCNVKFTLKSQLESHIRNHTCERPFFCDECKRGYSLKGSLTRHIRKFHRGLQKIQNKKTYKCSLCPYEAHQKESLERHIRTHTGERAFPCRKPNCGYAAKSTNELRCHNINKHKNERKFLCPFPNCGYRGKTARDISQHSTTHSDYKPFVCDFPGCSYRAKRQNLVNRHKLGVHHGGYKPFACTRCNYRATSKFLLTSHELTHKEEKSFKCNFSGCTYSCKYRTALRSHVLSHHKEKTFKCDFAGCFATAATRHRLLNHKKDVHYEKFHKCSRCNYRTSRRGLLRKHLERHHTSQRTPGPNEGLNFEGRNQDSLNPQMRYHQANLCCPIEGCRYIRRSNSSWTRHMKRHSPTGRPYVCPLCSKCFPANERLMRHLQKHLNEKPWRCPVCNYESGSKADFSTHVRAVHSTVFPDFVFDAESVCDHCGMSFGCATGLVMHELKVKTAVVVLARLKLK